jgi:hypothetical protein
MMNVLINIANLARAFMPLHVAVAAFNAYRRQFTHHARGRLEEAFLFVNSLL